MQNDPAISISEPEIIELPEMTDATAEQSAVSRIIFWAALLAVGAGAIYVLYFHGVSQASGALRSEELPTPGFADPFRLSEFLIGGPDQAPGLRGEMSQCGQTLRALLTSESPIQFPLASLKCNPFRQPDLAATSASGIQRPTTNPDAQGHTEAERTTMLRAVEAMQLQSIVCTDTRRSCMINNVLYDEGGILNGFTIEQINAQSVVVRNGLYRFELTMNR
jgi:hypothetical protein